MSKFKLKHEQSGSYEVLDDGKMFMVKLVTHNNYAFKMLGFISKSTDHDLIYIEHSREETMLQILRFIYGKNDNKTKKDEKIMNSIYEFYGCTSQTCDITFVKQDGKLMLYDLNECHGTLEEIRSDIKKIGIDSVIDQHGLVIS